VQRSERCTTPAAVAAAVLQCLCRLACATAVPLPLSLGLKPQGGSSRRRRGGALVLVVGRSLRPAPDAVAARFFRPLLMARGRPTPVAEPQRPSSLGPHMPTPSGGLVAAPTPSRRGLCWWDPDEGNRAEPQGTLADTASRVCTPSGPGDTPRQRRVDGSPTCGEEGRQRNKGRVPLERQNPHPQNTRTLRPWANLRRREYPHATAFGKFEAPRQNPHVLPPGLGSTHPKGGSIGFGLLVMKRGVRERDEACETRSQQRKEAQSRLLSLLQIAGTRG
jgi:hypothetical protein